MRMIVRRVFRELERVVQYFVVHSLHVRVVEGGEAADHLEEKGAERPPVHRLSMALVLQNLGGKILGGAAEGTRAALGSRAGDLVLGQAEVGQADVAVGVQQDVLGLQVAIDDVRRVHGLQSHGHLSSIQSRPRFGKATVLLQPEEQLAAGHVVQNHISADNGGRLVRCYYHVHDIKRYTIFLSSGRQTLGAPGMDCGVSAECNARSRCARPGSASAEPLYAVSSSHTAGLWSRLLS